MREASGLRAWLPAQRWFAGKSAPILSVDVTDEADMGGGVRLAVADVVSAGLPAARYFLLLDADGNAPAGKDPLALPEVRQRWFERLRRSAHLPGGAATFEFQWLVGPAPASASSRLLSAEQSNTSVLYYDAASTPRWLCKLFRRLMPGENPEFEVPRALALHTPFRHIPAVRARVIYSDYTLAVLQDFVPNQGDGWQYVLRGLPDRAAGDRLLADLERLGRRTAELHLALASIHGDLAFKPEPVAPADLERWRGRAAAAVRSPEMRPYATLLQPWVRRLSGPTSGLEACLGLSRIRLHGDYHLGQVLKTEEDFVIFDFEGEPARPIPERRQKGCVLQDVAGMLRSFSYAAHSARRPEWEAGARAAFLDAYLAAIGSASGLVPNDNAALRAALSFFECEKAVYELAYELNHRPDWVAVPLAGLNRLLATPTS